MRPSGMHYFPLAWPFILAFLVLLIIVVASIGGAGTFHGIFLTGILAVLLSPVAGPPRRQQMPEEQSP